MNCGFGALTAKPLACYPRRFEATAVVDCSINLSAVVDCGFSRVNGINA